VVRLISANAETDLSIELQLGVNKVGRQRNGNHIVLVSGEVSRFHAEVDVTGDEIQVRDLGSSNGTFINGERVEKGTLEAGDTVSFSNQFAFQVQVELSGALENLAALPVAPPSPAPLPAPLPVAPAPSPDASASGSKRRTAPRGQAPKPRTAAPIQNPPAPVAASNQAPPAPVAPAPVPVSPFAPASDAPVAVRSRSSRAAPAAPIAAAAARPAPASDLLHEGLPTAPDDGSSGGGNALEEEDSLLEPLGSAADAADLKTASESPEVAVLERERRQLAVLYQVSKRCMSAESLAELDRLLVNVLERVVSFQRGFITYQLPSGDWKLVMSPKGDRWDRNVVRSLLQTALKLKVPLAVAASASDDRLGNAGPGQNDARLLLPLRSRSSPVGAIFLVSNRADSFDDQTVDFLSLFADIAALAVVNCARLEASKRA
jgi:hypothetical protein